MIAFPDAGGICLETRVDFRARLRVPLEALLFRGIVAENQVKCCARFGCDRYSLDLSPPGYHAVFVGGAEHGHAAPLIPMCLNDLLDVLTANGPAEAHQVTQWLPDALEANSRGYLVPGAEGATVLRVDTYCRALPGFCDHIEIKCM